MVRGKKDPDLVYVEMAREGRLEGVQALYEKYFAAVYRFCFWQTGRSEDAEDLTQDVFVAMARSIQHFREEASFKNWLYSIAKNVIAQWITRKKHLTTQPLFEELVDSEEWIDPENEQFKQQQINELLQKLAPTERKVIQLRYLRNFSVEETAKKLKLSESNVKVMTHRALKKLRM